MNVNYEIEDIGLEEREENDIIELLDLTEEQEETINPQIPHTSGIRMNIFQKAADKYIMTKEKQHMFLRVFKAVSEVAKKEIGKENPKVLLVSDDRPSGSYLVEYCAKVMAHHGFELYFQETYDPELKKDAENDPFYTRMGTPYASCSLSLYEEVDTVIVITASHNSILWNGVKIYINLAFPISGRVMQEISQSAINLKQIELSKQVDPLYINADAKNNQYIKDLLGKMIDVSVLKGKNVVLWPFMGKAPELQSLLEDLGVNLIVIDEDVNPPNPTDDFDREKVENALKTNDANIAILLDADRDRIIFLLKDPQSSDASPQYISLSPNELYTAMHNLLVKIYDKKLVNVRTIPSDPRCDNASNLNLITGVGYKHLGMVLYSAIGEEIDNETFQTGILYVKTDEGFEKLSNPQKVRNAFIESGIRGEDIVLVLWEESGGNTFNILSVLDNEDTGETEIKSILPPLGDKYPAVAICILTTLIEQGHDLTQAIDQNIIGTRTKYTANDKTKVKIMKAFSEKKGDSIQMGDFSFKVSTFEQINGKISVIHFGRVDTDIYLRPSGTGPYVRIYVYGPKDTAVEQMNAVKDKLVELFG